MSPPNRPPAPQMYEERRDLYVGRYMIHSDFAVQGPDGEVSPPRVTAAP